MDNSKLAINTYDKIAHIYTEHYFNDLTDTPYIDQFVSRLSKQAKILEVGCGPGELTKYLLSKGYDTTGIDLSEAMIAIAKERVASGHFSIMDMRTLSYADGTFDGILAAYSLIHIPSNQVVCTLKEWRRVLTRAGYLMVIAQQGKPDAIVDEPLLAGQKMFINFFTQENLTGCLQTAGFSVVHQVKVALQDPDALSDTVIYTTAQRM